MLLPSSSRGAENSGALQREVKEEDEEGQGHVNMATWEGQKWKSGEVGAQALACLVLREMEIEREKVERESRVFYCETEA